MANFEDRSIEIDEFAMFQARSMGVETEYLEMAKAGRLAGRSPRCQGGSDDGSPTASCSTGRRRQQRSADGRHRSSRGSSGRGTSDDEGSTRSPRQSDPGRGGDDLGCDSPGSNGPIREGHSGTGTPKLEGIVDADGIEVDVSDESQSLQRAHSFRTKRNDARHAWVNDENTEGASDRPSPASLEVKSDLKRTLTMPAKRYRDRNSGRNSIRSWNQSSRSNPLEDDDNTCQEPTGMTDHSLGSSNHRTACNGSDPERTTRSGPAGSWKDSGNNGHGGVCTSSSSSSSAVHGKKACLIRHDSSGSHAIRAHQTPDRNSNDGHRPAADESGKGRLLASRVERPGDDVTVYKVLVLGSQGVGKSTVTQQLLSVGTNEEDEDDSSDRIVCVQVDDEESFLEFIDSANTQANRAKQCVDANLVVYSVTDRCSFSFAQTCLQELRPAKRHNVVILVANKQDLVRNRVISEDDGKNLAAKRHCKFIEVSALLSLKMDDLLAGIARQIRLRKGRGASGPTAPGPEGAVGRGAGGADASGPDGGFDTSFGCLQRAALRAIRKVFRRRPVESTSCDNLCTP